MKLDGLNDMQKRAVKRTEGPLLIIAGAGSGKTRVLTNRIAYLIDECEVSPYNILAITFTNKAAKEMKERVEQTVPEGGQVWVSTFHSTCVRILRRYIDRLGYSTNFTIYDTDDQKSVVKEICKKMNIDTKMLKERTILNEISKAKDEMITPDEMEINAGNDYNGKRIANVYREYQKTLKLNNALDFDDLIFKTVELFERNEDVLDSYQERFRYIMVDEYQDTNSSQFRLIWLLAKKYGNLCVVGDDDQSIYKFRGANIGNILNFESAFSGAKVIKLEQNYRSTQTILDAANSVIQHNVGRKDKSLWTENGEGEKIHFDVYQDGYQEAEGVVNSICDKVRDGWNYDDIAILYRTNAQSRLLEEKLLMRNVPYRIYGGVNFYQRKEIKDILAYLKTIDNGMDGQAVKRIINVPKRGIGATTIERIQTFADENDCTFWDALCNAEHIPSLGRSYKKLEPFITMMLGFKAKMQYLSIQELTQTILDDIGYMEALAESETKDEVQARQENIDEFMNKIVAYETDQDREEEPTLSGFLEEVALVSDIDNLNQTGEQVMLMTLHSAKGLEFPIVYMTGLEDGLFPSYLSIMSDDPTDIEEERRLCYVGITRAKKELTISSAKMRMVRGETQMNKVSRFVKEIPEKYLEMDNHADHRGGKSVSFGGEADQEAEGRYNFRANAKSLLQMYGGGSVAQSDNNRVKIEGAGKSTYMQRMKNTYQKAAYDTAYDRNKKPSYSRNTTNYSAGAQGIVKKVTNAEPNKKVGFGKEFPMDLFDLKKPVKKQATQDASAANRTKPTTEQFKQAFSAKESYSTQRIRSEVAQIKSDRAGNAEKILGYGVGDTVVSAKFGTGVVRKIETGDRDYMVTTEFEEYGNRRMLAGFAKLKKQ